MIVSKRSRRGTSGHACVARARVLDVRMANRRHETGASLPLVLVPGTLCDERLFAPLRGRLHHIASHVLFTSKVGSVREAAEHVLAVAPERFAVLGFSLGGMVAMEMALLAPDRVRGLALLSTSPLPVPSERHETRRAMVQRAKHTGLRAFVQEHLWPEYGGAEEFQGALPLLQAMAESLGHTTFAQQTEMALTRADYREPLHAVRCPALVLAGTQDRLCPAAAQQALAAALPHATFVSLPEAGHLALLEKTDEVALAVAAWFHTVEQAEPRASAAQRAGRGLKGSV